MAVLQVSIKVDEILAMQIQTVEAWHRSEPKNLFLQDGEAVSLMAITCQQHLYNYLLWHQEDIARSPDVSDSEIARVKRQIDIYNQQRNDWIEKIDDWLTEELRSLEIECRPDARLNTETPGSVLDRLSILSLRIYHLSEQLDRTDTTQEHSEKVERRLAICRLQHEELSQSLRELLDDIYDGSKRHRTYRQLKMYNDPSLNPYLYKRNN